MTRITAVIQSWHIHTHNNNFHDFHTHIHTPLIFMISTHTNTQNSVFMISTINCMEACDVNVLSRKILGKSDSFTLKKTTTKQNKTKQNKKNTHTHTHTLKMTVDRLNRIYYFKDYLHVNSVLWITEFTGDRQLSISTNVTCLKRWHWNLGHSEVSSKEVGESQVCWQKLQ